MNSPRISVREAFDRHAIHYDDRFSFQTSAQVMRQEVWRIADAIFPAQGRLLDIGSGTGEDAIHFAQRGVHVTAVDIAPAMVAQLLLKVDSQNLHHRIQAFAADIETFVPKESHFDGFFSNFGALNCTSRLKWLHGLATRCLAPGSFVVLVTMGRFYPLETAAFLLKGEVRKAFRRLQRAPQVRIEGVYVPVRYHSPADLRHSLGSDFSLVKVAGLRSFLPTPSLQHLERFLPLRILRPLDSLITRAPFTAAFADHYISVWRYR